MRKTSVSVLAGFIALALSQACSSSTPSAPANGPGGGSTGPVAIKIAQNPWDSSRLNVAIAKILLTEQMGFDVAVTEGDQGTQWDSIVSGDLHVNLEVWPVVHADKVAQYVTSGKVENAGALGPVGKIGWFVPTYMLTTHPELATWSGFKDPSVAAMFATPQSQGKGQFLNGDKSWGSYDADIIKNLGLDFQVVWAGSEGAELSALESAYARRSPLLFYLWTPHYALAKYDLTPVQLPAYSDGCYAKAASGGVDCDYPAEHLLKVSWLGFKDYAPRAYAFIKNFQYTTKDQIDLLGKVTNEHASIDEAARWWVNTHSSVWANWIPPQ